MALKPRKSLREPPSADKDTKSKKSETGSKEGVEGKTPERGSKEGVSAATDSKGPKSEKGFKEAATAAEAPAVQTPGFGMEADVESGMGMESSPEVNFDSGSRSPE
ncbi:unnamed protein product [Nippostrongylus brasiliensis]|uniref:PEST proteolytic signal-containing nuclear protein n=1 Tax=Nippostrongylus brasiliensis TaxID=27835 RepID=A0A0N4YB41_NIPBR|nr:unnamed protein product [Nippostrongylus brasiliensis]